MTTQEILTLAIALSISVIVLIIARQLSTSKKSSNAYNVTIYQPKKKRKLDSGKSKLLDIYKSLMRIPLYNNHVRMVERQYTILYPNDQKTARKKATKLILWSTLISILSLIAVIVISGTVYMIVVTIVLIVVLNTYLVRMRIESCLLYTSYHNLPSTFQLDYSKCPVDVALDFVDGGDHSAAEIKRQLIEDLS